MKVKLREFCEANKGLGLTELGRGKTSACEHVIQLINEGRTMEFIKHECDNLANVFEMKPDGITRHQQGRMMVYKKVSAFLSDEPTEPKLYLMTDLHRNNLMMVTAENATEANKIADQHKFSYNFTKEVSDDEVPLRVTYLGLDGNRIEV